jgi:hypothetical protein
LPNGMAPPRTIPPAVADPKADPAGHLLWRLYPIVERFERAVFTAHQVLERYHSEGPGWPETVDELVPHLNVLTSAKYNVLQLVSSPEQPNEKEWRYLYVPP